MKLWSIHILWIAFFVLVMCLVSASWLSKQMTFFPEARSARSRTQLTSALQLQRDSAVVLGTIYSFGTPSTASQWRSHLRHERPQFSETVP